MKKILFLTCLLPSAAAADVCENSARLFAQVNYLETNVVGLKLGQKFSTPAPLCSSVAQENIDTLDGLLNLRSELTSEIKRVMAWGYDAIDAARRECRRKGSAREVRKCLRRI